MKKIYFKIPDIGNLHLHKILLQIDDPPLLFVCTDSNGKYYLGECIDSYEYPYEYLLVSTTIDILIKMLTNKMTMYEAFKKSPESIAYKIKNTEKVKQDIVSSLPLNNVADEDLPLKGAFFEIDTDYIQKYILELCGYKIHYSTELLTETLY